MNLYSQTRAVTFLNLANIPSRLGTSLVIILGIAGVVAVFISTLAMATGLQRAVSVTGRSDRAVVIRNGASAESASSLSRDAVNTIMEAPGVRKDAQGEAIGSPEPLMIVDVPLKSSNTEANVALRGIGTMNAQLRPELKIIVGRMFRPGVRELIVGHNTQTQFKGLEIGDHLILRNTDWRVVGVFSTGGDAHELELMADTNTVLGAYDRNVVQSVTVLLNSRDAFAHFKSFLTSNPALSVDVQRESDYFAKEASGEVSIIRFVAFVVGGIMALGAVFGALNTMYSAVSARTVEIATLRAIGFGPGAVITSVLIEALVLALVGAGFGAALAWQFFDGKGVSALNLGSFTQLVFYLRVTPDLIASGIFWACLVALIGGIFPAIRAARLPITAALGTGM